MCEHHTFVCTSDFLSLGGGQTFFIQSGGNKHVYTGVAGKHVYTLGGQTFLYTGGGDRGTNIFLLMMITVGNVSALNILSREVRKPRKPLQGPEMLVVHTSDLCIARCFTKSYVILSSPPFK